MLSLSGSQFLQVHLRSLCWICLSALMMHLILKTWTGNVQKQTGCVWIHNLSLITGWRRLSTSCSCFCCTFVLLNFLCQFISSMAVHLHRKYSVPSLICASCHSQKLIYLKVGEDGVLDRTLSREPVQYVKENMRRKRNPLQKLSSWRQKILTWCRDFPWRGSKYKPTY